MLKWFWSEKFWLPENTTWLDVTNEIGKKVVYAELKDLWSVPPFTAGILISRYILEKYCFFSLGRLLNISDAKRKRPAYNAVLEAAYRKSSTFKDPVSLAKQLDMTGRQVERWWRLRRSQDKPSTLVKFSESLWILVHYICSFSFGLYVLWDKAWFRNLEDTFTGYPHQGISNDIWWYYMCCTSFYTSLAITQFRDVRRKDFWQIFVHHIATIALLGCSWVSNLHRIGTLILLLHDSSDLVLEMTKAVEYGGLRGIRWCYFVFTILWIVTRLVVFPFFILPFTLTRMNISPLTCTLSLLLCVLQMLHLFWTWLILKIACNTTIYGKDTEYIRTSNSEEG